MPDLKLEGWYTDPFDQHEARWFSAGVPTSLVRDAGTESHDAPPDGLPRHRPERIVSADSTDTLRRADDAQREEIDGRDIADAASIGIDAAVGTG
jgi:hypothetical protein